MGKRKEANMAKRERIRKMKEGEVPASQLSDVEKADLATASAATEPVETGKDGETTSNRLPYKLLEKDAMEYVHTIAPWLTRRDNFGVFEAPARLAGASLTLEWARDFVGFDGDEVACPEKKGGNPCGFRFRPLRQADLNEDGSFRTDERLVSKTNPQGIRYRGSYAVVPVTPKERHSKRRIIGPVCRRDAQLLRAAYRASGWYINMFDRAGAEALAAALNTALDKSHEAWLARRDEIARERGLVTEDGQHVKRGGGRFRNTPHMATAGRPNRH